MYQDTSTHLIEREHAVLFQNYRRLPIVISHALGCRIFDVEGHSWLDMLGGIAVNALGHSHPDVIEAVTQQLKRYAHVSNFFYQEPQISLAEMLVQATGMERVFFSNSGTEANELAIKMIRRHGAQRNRYDVVAFSGGFHGRTYGALSLMDNPVYRQDMGPFLPNTLTLPYNDVDALEARIDESTAGIILEFIQGEGGLRQASPEFIDAIFMLREKYELLVVADEVQTGLGRTGDFFAHSHYGVKPDIITMAKALGGGLPLGAVLATGSAAELIGKGAHGSTYGGNPLACAAGLAVMKAVVDNLLSHVESVGSYLAARLKETCATFPLSALEVRGRGLIAGLHLSSPASQVVEALLSKHVIANATSGTVIRLVPPYVITRTDVDEFVSALNQVLSEGKGAG